jgi:hypothetical protein
MRSADVVLRDLEDLNAVLGELQSQQFESYSGPWVMQESLTRRRTQLVEELSATLHELRAPVLAFLVEGGPATTESIRAGFLGQMLIHLQETIYGMVQAATEGARLTGAFSESVMRAGTLRVSGMARGSYGVLLEGPTLPIQQSLMADDVADRSVLETSVADLLELLALASEGGDEQLLSRALDTAPRAITHLRDIAARSSSSGARLKLNWNSPDTEARYVELGQVDAKRLADTLRDIETASREEEVQGTLAELSMIRDRFTLVLDDQTIRRGTVDLSVREDVAGFMNRACRALLITTTTQSKATGRLRETAHLVGIGPA